MKCDDPGCMTPDDDPKRITIEHADRTTTIRIMCAPDRQLLGDAFRKGFTTSQRIA